MPLSLYFKALSHLTTIACCYITQLHCCLHPQVSKMKCIFLPIYSTHTGNWSYSTKASTVTQEPLDLDFKGYGLKLHVPEGALPAEVSETQLDVQVSLSGHFQMPSDSRLTSALYWVTTPHKFIKPVSVEIQHCATLINDKQCSHLMFVHSMHSQKKLPYMFTEQDGGFFTPHSSYGLLSLSHLLVLI